MLNFHFNQMLVYKSGIFQNRTMCIILRICVRMTGIVQECQGIFFLIKHAYFAAKSLLGATSGQIHITEPDWPGLA